MSVILTGVCAGYGPEKPVLTDFSLTLPEAGTVAVMGPSGRGKTTLLRVLSEQLKPTAGKISGMEGKGVSMVFQEDRLLPWRTAIENVISVLPGKDRGADRELALLWLNQMELSDAVDELPGALSGGMRRRVALARACAYGGDILLLDEPFKGLDAALKERVANAIKKAAPLILMVSHDREEAALMDAVTIEL